MKNNVLKLEFDGKASLLKKGKQLIEQGKYEDAEMTLKMLLLIDPENKEALENIGISHLRKESLVSRIEFSRIFNQSLSKAVSPLINIFFLLDIVSISLSYFLAFLVRFGGSFDQIIMGYFLRTLPLVLGSKIFTFYLIGLYRVDWQYPSGKDWLHIYKAASVGSILSICLLLLIPGLGFASRSVMIIDFLIFLFLATAIRLSLRILEHYHRKMTRHGRNVLIYGVGRNGVYAIEEIIHNPRYSSLIPFGFIDDDTRYKGRRINGYPVLGTLESLEEILKKKLISEVFISREDIPKENLARLSLICTSYGIPFYRFGPHLEELHNDN